MPAKVSLEAIKRLRDKTGAPVGAVRKALETAGGDELKALELLRQQGAQLADKRQGRATSQGRVEAYVHHNGQLGALVEVGCETDFVARTDDFRQFCKELAMHVAATEEAPLASLLEQPFIKDPGTTVGGLLKALIGKTGENVVIKRVAKFSIGAAG
ncbi:MAG: translation elongation factor Ts [Candidatus Omnitrophica bacterium]|nr:translation elongation factor Ts [Candidatus Omnitrophota bacterium]